MKYLMMAAALCAGTLSAHAQTTKTDLKSSSTKAQKPATLNEHRDCLHTTEAEWKAMGLTGQQITEVKAVQAEHEKACAGMKKDDSATASLMEKDEQRVKELLLPEQYESWKHQCTAMSTQDKPMDKK